MFQKRLMRNIIQIFKKIEFSFPSPTMYQNNENLVWLEFHSFKGLGLKWIKIIPYSDIISSLNPLGKKNIICCKDATSSTKNKKYIFTITTSSYAIKGFVSRKYFICNCTIQTLSNANEIFSMQGFSPPIYSK